MFFYAISTPPRYLAICRALKVFSYHNLNRSSTVGGSNKKVPGSSIAFRHLMDRSSFSFVSLLHSSTLPRQLYLSTLFFSTPSSTDGLTPLDTFICRELLKRYILGCLYLVLIFSIYPLLFSSQTLSSPSKPSAHVIFDLFFLQITWYVFFFSHSS